ncbi:MAG: EboA domain-containing protein, partial [Bacteroidota bacterium]
MASGKTKKANYIAYQKAIKMIFTELIKKTLELNLTKEEFLWLQTIRSADNNAGRLQMAFVTVPKYIKKGSIDLTKDILNEFKINIGFSPESWTTHQLARVHILLQFEPQNKKEYIDSINELFETAEINELTALYSSLFFLHYPKNWLPHAKDAVRSNMGTAYDAIAF